MEQVELDPQRQEKAKEYARISRRLFVLDLVWGGIYALAWLVFGWAKGLGAFWRQYTNSPWLLVLGFAAVFGGIYLILNLPLSYYSEFVLPHKYDMSNQTVRGWISDQLKSLLVGAILGGLVLEVIYAILRAFPTTWWLWAAGFLLLFSVILANLAPVLLMPLFYKFIPLGEEHTDLIQRLMRLAERAHTRVKGVYKFDMSRRTKAANAALTGLGNTRRIILGDTLLNEFTPDEIETVLAHELGHHVHKDIPVGMAVETVTTLVGLFLASLVMNWGVKIFGFQSAADPASLPLFMLVLGVYGLITMPVSNAYSRWRESRADEYALQTTHKPEAFATAMTRLANQNLSEAEPEPWVEWLLYSHPSLGKRIQMARQFEGQGLAPATENL